MSVTSHKITGNDLKTEIEKLIQPLGGISTYVHPGNRVLIKPNFNTADPYPASTDPEFLKALVEIVLSAEPKSVIIGDSSTIMLNPDNVFSKLNIRSIESIDSRVEVINFRSGRWTTKIVPNGKYLKKVRLPSVLDEIDTLILLPCLKTHHMAQFTGSLKLGVGFMHHLDRISLHMGHLQEKIAELNLLFKPNLIVMDGRKCFITGGPSEGEIREPGVLLASESRVEIDMEAVKIIQSFEGNSLDRITPEQLPQIQFAIAVGVK